MINEAAVKHDTLNPKLWNTDTMELKPEVHDKILEIVDDFLKDLENDEIRINVKDIKIVGSNCSYNWGPKSDADVHIVAEHIDAPDNVYSLIYSAYRSLWNKKRDISLYGVPIELYIEIDGETLVEPTSIDVDEKEIDNEK